MQPVITKSKTPSVPLIAVFEKDFAGWLKKQKTAEKRWIETNRFTAAAGQFCLMPAPDGHLEKVICGLGKELTLWSLAHLPLALPPLSYHLETAFKKEQATRLALGWGLGCYRFTRYKKHTKPYASLVAPKGVDMRYIDSMGTGINWARDLINTPANDMNPKTLAEEAANWARSAGASVSVVKGEALLKANYPTVYAVGKASSVPPHMVDIRFARKGAPKVTLVGKGVCFDTGGLDLKSSSNMRLMKKDMAGVAILLALAKALIETKIPIQLRLLLPMVENAVGGNATRPSDIVKTRKGITVEIGNTDAEGRLILCDALYEADEETPDLLIDCTTLTGAARVALGLEVPAFFTPDDKLAAEVIAHSKREQDPLWRLPLWKNYRAFLDTPYADISNDPDHGYGGAITAALYLQEFVSKTPSWLHIDMMAWNLSAKPGRPQGGEAMAVRTLYALIKDRYGR